MHHHLLQWRRRERSVGRALRREAWIVEILASLPPKIAGSFEDHPLRRCLSCKEVLHALRLYSDLTQKIISEQTKCSQSFDYVRLSLIVQVYFLQHRKNR